MPIITASRRMRSRTTGSREAERGVPRLIRDESKTIKVLMAKTMAYGAAVQIGLAPNNRGSNIL